MPVTAITRLVPSLLSWVFFVTYVYNGEPFEYMFEVGSVMIPEDAAQALVDRNKYADRARQMFLREVPLGPEVNDLELRTA